MTERYLTTDQAADYLGISSATLAGMRRKRTGPKYLLLTDPNPDRAARKALRYSIAHLEEYLAARKVEVTKRRPTPTRRIEPRRISDAEWATVVAAVHPRGEDGYLTGHAVTAASRRRFDEMLAACEAGGWASPKPRHLLRKLVRFGGWVPAAFDALAAFDDFPFILTIRWAVVRRGRRKDLPTQELHLRTDMHGPLHGRETRSVNPIAQRIRPQRKPRARLVGDRVCVVCGTTYAAGDRRQRYCSIQCRRDWHHTQERTAKGIVAIPTQGECARCGTPFKPVKWTQKFCTSICRDLAKRARRAATAP